jgi:hypothetical protein
VARESMCFFDGRRAVVYVKILRIEITAAKNPEE